MQSLADIIRADRKENPTKETAMKPISERAREFYLWKMKVDALPVDNISLILQHKQKARIRSRGSIEIVEATIEQADGFIIDAYEVEDKEKGTKKSCYYLWDNKANKCYERKLI